MVSETIDFTFHSQDLFEFRANPIDLYLYSFRWTLHLWEIKLLQTLQLNQLLHDR